MALTKVQADGINVADDFAFTGTVTGAGVSTATSTLPSEGGAVTTVVAQGLAKQWVNRIPPAANSSMCGVRTPWPP